MFYCTYGHVDVTWNNGKYFKVKPWTQGTWKLVLNSVTTLTATISEQLK